MNKCRVWILDFNFLPLYCIDDYKSVIWNSKYSEAGDFELCIQRREHNKFLYENSLLGYYVYLEDQYNSNLLENTTGLDSKCEYMIIESVTMEYDIEGGSFIILKGRSLSSLLTRRTIWNPLSFSDHVPERSDPLTIETIIEQLCYASIINPQKAVKNSDDTYRLEPYENRTFNGGLIITWENNRSDEATSAFRIDEHGEEYGDANLFSIMFKSIDYDPCVFFPGDNLYSIIQSFCEAYGYGFRIDHNPNSNFRYKLVFYNGNDKTINQIDLNPSHVGSYKNHIQYSPAIYLYKERGGIKSSSIQSDLYTYKNIVQVCSSDAQQELTGAKYGAASRSIGNYAIEYFYLETDQKDNTEIGSIGVYPGNEEPDKLDRYETAITIDVDLDHKLNLQGFRKKTALSQFHSNGVNALVEYDVNKESSLEVSEYSNYIFKKDYDLGDLITIKDDYGIEYCAMITEVLRSYDENGYRCYPTFKYVEQIPTQKTLRTVPFPMYDGDPIEPNNT